MSELPTSAGVDAQSASRALIWRRPRWAARLQPAPMAHLLDEAHAVGLTGRGALSGPARILLSDGGEAAVAAMAKTLPEPIDYFLVQADLTVVVPGPLKRDLADELAAVAAVDPPVRPWCTGSVSSRYATLSTPGEPLRALQKLLPAFPKPLCRKG